MSIKVAFQMDSPETINIDKDSTFVLAMEAQARGHRLFYYHPSSLALHQNCLKALAYPLEFRRREGDHVILGKAELVETSEFDLILMRQDPPFDLAYITATHLLEHVMNHTLVLNDPVSVRNAPEKLLITHFPDLMPPTLITASTQALKGFYQEHKDIILKPLYGNAGAQIFRVKPDGNNLNSILEMFLESDRTPIVAQKFLPEITDGDKRIILIDGQPAGGVTRKAAAGEIRANFHVGGTGHKTGLSPREEEICARIGPELVKRGLVFAGIDVIGNYLTEINVTSPTGLQEINALNNDCLEKKLWDAFEDRLSNFKALRL